MKTRFLVPAREELHAAVEFYDDQAAGLGSDFIDETERTLQTLQDSPRIGTPLTDETRRFPLRRFPFYLVYTVDPELLVIVAVAHQRRKPGYWDDRT